MTTSAVIAACVATVINNWETQASTVTNKCPDAHQQNTFWQLDTKPKAVDVPNIPTAAPPANIYYDQYLLHKIQQKLLQQRMDQMKKEGKG